VGYQAVAMHVFALWFSWFVDLSLVRCVAVLIAFVAEETILMAGHHGSSQQPVHLMTAC
jgi:hypothetical protein